jgi:hypothetical protein
MLNLPVATIISPAELGVDGAIRLPLLRGAADLNADAKCVTIPETGRLK